MNILAELQKQREKNIIFQQNSLLNEVYSILNEPKSFSKKTRNNYYNSATELLKDKITSVDNKRLFSLTDIRDVCINYRLRFLEKKHFKAELPYDIHIKSTAFEMEVAVPVTFYILTETENFKSRYPNTQQLIFAHLGNNEFYFIAQWGNEYSNYRKIAVMPYKNVEFLFLFILFIAFSLTLITPTSFLTTNPKVEYFSMLRIAYFFWCTVFIASIYTYYIVGIRKGMNSSEWDNPSIM